MHTGCITILHDMCMQVMVAINAAKQQLCVLKQNSRSISYMYVHRRLSNTMSMCTIWACTRVNTSSSVMHCLDYHAVAKPGLLRLLSFDALVFKISQGSLPVLLLYRWTFQGEK